MAAVAPLNYAPLPSTRRWRRWLWPTVILVALLASAAAAVSIRAHVAKREGMRIARVGTANADVANITSALDTFEIDVSRYPTAGEGLGALVRPVAGPSVKVWHGPYLRRGVPLDPWGRPYIYTPPASSSPAWVISLGPDGKQGTTDDIRASTGPSAPPWGGFGYPDRTPGTAAAWRARHRRSARTTPAAADEPPSATGPP